MFRYAGSGAAACQLYVDVRERCRVRYNVRCDICPDVVSPSLRIFHTQAAAARKCVVRRVELTQRYVSKTRVCHARVVAACRYSLMAMFMRGDQERQDWRAATRTAICLSTTRMHDAAERLPGREKDGGG